MKVYRHFCLVVLSDIEVLNDSIIDNKTSQNKDWKL